MSDSIQPGSESLENSKPEDETRPVSALSGMDEPLASGRKDTDGPGPESVAPKELRPPGVRWIYRHTLPVRLAHWINVLCLPILVMSGLQIFNAHPALYLGERSDRDRPILSLDSTYSESSGIRGITTVFGYSFDTTGWFGASADSDGRIHRRGFPAWATIPSHQWLAMGRRWHFFFAWIFVINGLLFGLYALFSRHLDRDMIPFKKDLRGIGQAVQNHLRFHPATGEEAGHYNVLQKLAYTGVVFVLGPLVILTGLTMSPRMDAAFPVLLTLFGGRQSARTIHFIVCFSFVGFIGIHLFMVVVSGLWNNLRSMVLGRYRMTEFGAEPHDQKTD